MRADSLAAKSPSRTDLKRLLKRPPSLKALTKFQNAAEDNSSLTPTLFDVMGWKFDGGDKDTNSDAQDDSSKLPNIAADSNVSYIDKLESEGGLKSPTARH